MHEFSGAIVVVRFVLGRGAGSYCVGLWVSNAMPILDDCAQPTKPTNPHIVHTYNHQPSNQPFKPGYACVVCNSPHRFVLLLCKSIWALGFLRQGIVVLLSALAQTHILRPVLCPGKPGRFYPDFIPYHCQYWCLSGGSCGSSHGCCCCCCDCLTAKVR